MVFKGILLRLCQIVSAAVAIYFLILAGTLAFQSQMDAAYRFAVISGGVWIVWAILSLFVMRSTVELVREVAIVVYPVGALLSLVLSVVFGYWMESMLVKEPEREIWTFILAGVLIAIVMIIKCFDIQWLRTADEVRPNHAGVDLDDEYGPMI